MEYLTNPWVISIIVVAVIVGNIAALKYTANTKFGPLGKTPGEKSDLDKLNELDKKRHPESTDKKKEGS